MKKFLKASNMIKTKNPLNLIDQVTDDALAKLDPSGEFSKEDLFACSVAYCGAGLYLINKDTLPESVRMIGVLLLAVGFAAMILIKRRM